ncbi:hypothetical protein [Propionivibrio sp.]|uniref:hypothetical protein n=1 Tax=Propionivibrio sp. TaxID=2212460 RepID=UPI002609D0D0|nr:hypothetical protein [Propionivibrio sp.]
MNKTSSLPWHNFLVLALALASATTYARNTRLLFPITEVTKSSRAQQIIGQDMRLYFGESLPKEIGTPDIIEEVSVKAVANPVRSPGAKYNEEESDQRTCREAFRMALSDLSQKSRNKGGDAVINIVSFYNSVEMSSPTEYECHSGMTRSVVELKGRIVKLNPSAALHSGSQRLQSNAGEIMPRQ